jgi:hypothetical protein
VPVTAPLRVLPDYVRLAGDNRLAAFVNLAKSAHQNVLCLHFPARNGRRDEKCSRPKMAESLTCNSRPEVAARERIIPMTTQPVPTPDDLAAWLMTITEADFRNVVAKDVHKGLDWDAAQALRHPSVLVRWVRMLSVLLKDAHVQLAEKKHEPSIDREWFVKVARWEASIEASQAEARSLVRRFEAQAQHAENLVNKRARGEAREAAVCRLVNAHRQEFSQLLDEERAIAGLPAKVRPSTAVIPFTAPERATP